MFTELIRFELACRLKKPGAYIYFLLLFFFTVFLFTKGFLPLTGNQHVNAPASIAQYYAGMTMMMLLVTSAIMGMPLFRDIAYNTGAFYFSFPISRSGYFWGRFGGSFLVLVFISLAMPAGIYLGTKLGPLLHCMEQGRYGPDNWRFYWVSYTVIVLPNLFFSSCLFFGLVALLRNVKAIYSSGIFVLLGYLIGNFFIHASYNPYIIHLTDPFALNGIRSIIGGWQAEQKNALTIPVSGLFLANRVLWMLTGLAIVLYTWRKFSFEQFLSPPVNKKLPVKDEPVRATRVIPRLVFGGEYKQTTLISLVKIETLNILRDNYFWIIILAGNIFLGIIFANGPASFGLRDYPRAAMNLFLLNNNFLIVIFCILFFYAGETMHREKMSGFHIINDALPPDTWIFPVSKLLSVLFVCFLLLSSTMLPGVLAQIAKGNFQWNLPMYFKILYLSIFPRLFAVTLLAFAIQILLDNKFVAIGIGIAYLVLCQLAEQSSIFNYHLLLYSFGPFYALSDFDNIGHMMTAVSWFNIYWICAGGVLFLVACFFYKRGVAGSMRESIQVARARFNGTARVIFFVTAGLFAGCGAFVYYNVSYLNKYLTTDEKMGRQVMREKALQRFEKLAVPKVVSIDMTADLYPERQQSFFHADVVIVNKSKDSIADVLMDGEFLHKYEVRSEGKLLRFSEPLLYPRPLFSLFGAAKSSSGYRLYQLPKILAPGDSARLTMDTEYSFYGFQNDLYAANLLNNGTLTGICLPGFGYDADEELLDETDRKKYGLGKRVPGRQRDRALKDVDRLMSNAAIDLLDFSITISTASDQTAIGPGTLVKKWTANGRNYFSYSAKTPGLYMLPGIASARYKEQHEQLRVQGRNIDIALYYHPDHGKNVARLMWAYTSSIEICSNLFGAYPYQQMRLVETSIYAPVTNNIAATDFFSEQYGWNTNASLPSEIDYFLFNCGRQAARQWWGNQVAPNNMTGSVALKDGLSTFTALLIYEKNYGKRKTQKVLLQLMDWYLWNARQNAHQQHPVVCGELSTETDTKIALLLYGLKERIGEDQLIQLLQVFKKNWSYQRSAPFAGIVDLYSLLQKQVPEKDRETLADNWERVCFYDIGIVSAEWETQGSENPVLNLEVAVSKSIADSTGKEHIVNIQEETLDLLLSSGNGPEHTQLQTIKIHSGINHLSIQLPFRASFVQIDPGYKYMDRNRSANQKFILGGE